jgi:hydrogenase expression/formation protein HypD
MKYIHEFRDGHIAQQLAQTINNTVRHGRDYYLMEFCGGHTHAIHRYGVQDLLPENVHMIHGPGCPVCVLPMNRIDNAIELAGMPGVIFCSYGDMLRVPGSDSNSLLKAKTQGADVRMVYSCMDALAIAKDNPKRRVVFFAVGFETTTPPTAVAIQQAQATGLKNFSVFCNHVLTPPAINAILSSPEKVQVEGFVGPAHVSTIIGMHPYEQFVKTFHRPVVIAGFEPLDIMQAILMLVRQLNEGQARVENEYTRAVTAQGNIKAQQAVADVFELRDVFEWRGLGFLPHSGLKINDRYAEFDVERQFDLAKREWADHKACQCASVLRGGTKPNECKLFGNVCTPDTPVGPCMVSSEGACAAYYAYGRFRDVRKKELSR